MQTTISIKFFMDYICEWCFLGYGILKKLRGKYDFDLEIYPLEIHPDTPPDGMPMSWHVHNKKRWVDQLNQLGERYGIHLKNKEIFANTRNALIAGQYAKTVGKAEEYTEALWKAYMEEGKNISGKKAVEEIACGIGIMPGQLQEAYTDSVYGCALARNQQYQQAFGTDQVPAFVVNEKYIMIGAQSADTWEKLFQKLKEEQNCMS